MSDETGGVVLYFPEDRMGDREPWITKAALARRLERSERWIELRMREGLPHTKGDYSRLVRYRFSEVEMWLREQGRIISARPHDTPPAA